jgi:hypothetical protein
MKAAAATNRSINQAQAQGRGRSQPTIHVEELMTEDML